MLKPYSIRNEFLLTLIAGGICATMHYVLIQPCFCANWPSGNVRQMAWSFLRGLRKKRGANSFQLLLRLYGHV